MKKEQNKVMKEMKGVESYINKLYRSYKASVGWTTKYRNALMEANARLIEAGLSPVTVLSSDNLIKWRRGKTKPLIESLIVGKSFDDDKEINQLTRSETDKIMKQVNMFD